ncbi:MAG: hypothetical protein ACXVGB_14415 [Mycobacteriaceae bacterium]
MTTTLNPLHVIPVQDTNNNLGRRCDVLGRKDVAHRSWTIQSAHKNVMQNGSVTHYLLVNDSGETLLAARADLTYLY